MNLRNHIKNCLVALLAGGWASLAAAFSVQLQPTPGHIDVGQDVTVSVMVNGLAGEGQALSTYDIDIGFDSGMTFLRGMINAGPRGFEMGDWTIGESVFDWSNVDHVINLFQSSLLDDAELLYRQSDSFELAQLVFLSTAAGSFDFSLTANSLAGLLDPASGAATDLLAGEPAVRGINVTVGPRVGTVPEPASGALALLALSALIVSVTRCRPMPPASSGHR
jgi:hypothetical protein